MCGLAGFFLTNRIQTPAYKKAALLATLVAYMEERGRHSWGAYLPEKDEIIKDAGLPSTGFGTCMDKLINQKVVMIHTRAATVGDRNQENAHPWRFFHKDAPEKGQVIGMHNGSVMNDWSLKQKYGRHWAKVDSQHIFAHILDGLPSREVEAYGAIVMARRTAKRWRLELGRFNGGSLSIFGIGTYKQCDGIVWASTDAACTTALSLAGFKDYFPWKVTDNKLYTINSFNPMYWFAEEQDLDYPNPLGRRRVGGIVTYEHQPNRFISTVKAPITPLPGDKLKGTEEELDKIFMEYAKDSNWMLANLFVGCKGVYSYLEKCEECGLPATLQIPDKTVLCRQHFLKLRAANDPRLKTSDEVAEEKVKTAALDALNDDADATLEIDIPAEDDESPPKCLSRSALGYPECDVCREEADFFDRKSQSYLCTQCAGSLSIETSSLDMVFEDDEWETTPTKEHYLDVIFCDECLDDMATRVVHITKSDGLVYEYLVCEDCVDVARNKALRSGPIIAYRTTTNLNAVKEVDKARSRKIVEEKKRNTTPLKTKPTIKLIEAPKNQSTLPN